MDLQCFSRLDLDPTRNADPEPGGKKLLTKKEKSFLQMLCFEVLDVPLRKYEKIFPTVKFLNFWSSNTSVRIHIKVQ